MCSQGKCIPDLLYNPVSDSACSAQRCGDAACNGRCLAPFTHLQNGMCECTAGFTCQNGACRIHSGSTGYCNQKTTPGGTCIDTQSTEVKDGYCVCKATHHCGPDGLCHLPAGSGKCLDLVTASGTCEAHAHAERLVCTCDVGYKCLSGKCNAAGGNGWCNGMLDKTGTTASLTLNIPAPHEVLPGGSCLDRRAHPIEVGGVWGCYCRWGFECEETSGLCTTLCTGPTIRIGPQNETGTCECAPGYTCSADLQCTGGDSLGVRCDTECKGCSSDAACVEGALLFNGYCRCRPGFVCDYEYKICVDSEGKEVAPCNRAVGRGGCALNSATNVQGMCECFDNYVCSKGSTGVAKCRQGLQDICKSIRGLELEGTCKCDDDPVMGHWNGTSCESCYGDWFGENCELTCSVSTLPPYLWGSYDPSTDSCKCPVDASGMQTYGFVGRLCDECRPENGMFGDNCTDTSPLVTDRVTGTVENYGTKIFGPYAVLSYSEVTIELTVKDTTLAKLQKVELRVLPSYRSAESVYPSSESSSAATAARVQAQKDTVLNCLSSWDTAGQTGTCSVSIPRGDSNYFILYVENTDDTLEFSVVIKAVTGCCNGHGFCRQDPTDCRCVQDEEFGFFSEETQCKECFRGYSGESCNIFLGKLNYLMTSAPNTPLLAPSLGESLYYGVDVLPLTPFHAKLSGTGDCDLALTMENRCGSADWTLHDERCYRVVPACSGFEEAQRQCAAMGGTLGVPDGGISELQLIQKLINEAKLQGNSTCPHGDKVWIDLVQVEEADCSKVKSASDCTAPCMWDKFAMRCVQDPHQSCYQDPAYPADTETECNSKGTTVLIDGETKSKRCFWNRFNYLSEKGPTPYMGQPTPPYPLGRANRLRALGQCEPQYKLRFSSDPDGLRAMRLVYSPGFLLKHTVTQQDCTGPRVGCDSYGQVCPIPNPLDPFGYAPLDPLVHTPGECPLEDGKHFACQEKTITGGVCDFLPSCIAPPCTCSVCDYTGLAYMYRGNPIDTYQEEFVETTGGQWDPKKTKKHTRLCTVLAPDASKTDGTPPLRGVPAFCYDPFTTKDPAPVANQYKGGIGAIVNASFLCTKTPSRPLSGLKMVGKYPVVTTVPANKEVFAKPYCYDPERFSSTNDECLGYVPQGVGYMGLRVTCLDEGSTFNLTIGYVRTGKFQSGNSGECLDDAEDGHWAGSLCNECQIRWEGIACDVFDSCSRRPAQCHPNGECDAGTGYCVCKENYLGSRCEEYCGENTCGPYGRCNPLYGVVCNTTSQCTKLCICESPLQGKYCDTCPTGYWGDRCEHRCICSERGSKGCHKKTGDCICHSSAEKGFFDPDPATIVIKSTTPTLTIPVEGSSSAAVYANDCSRCQKNYYGLECKVYCTNATCSNHGYCSQSGKCVCDINWYGARCSRSCTATGCSGHGVCGSSGGCTCYADYTRGFWAGTSCEMCKPGYWGSACKQDCQCAMNGVCDPSTGECTCYSSDTLGYWKGETCTSCQEGYIGSKCTQKIITTSDRLSVIHKLTVDAADRSSKTYERLSGAILLVNSTGSTSCPSSGYTYLFAATGTDVAFWSRPCTGGVLDWTYRGACNLFGKLGYGEDIVNAVLHKGYIYVGLRGATKSAIVPFRATGTLDEVSMTSQCTTTGGGSVSERALTDFIGPTADGGTYDQILNAIGADSRHGYIYAAVTGFNSSDNTTSPVTYLTKIPLVYDTNNHAATPCTDASTTACSNTTEWVAAALHEDAEAVSMYQFLSATGIIVVDDPTSPFLLLLGNSQARQVIVTKVFTPNVAPGTLTLDSKAQHQRGLREVFTFTPSMCSSVPCESIEKTLIKGTWLIMAVQTYARASRTRGAILARLDLRSMKSESNTRFRVVGGEEWTGNQMGIGFLVSDEASRLGQAGGLNGTVDQTSIETPFDAQSFLYLGMRNATPSIIRKVRANNFTLESATLVLNYENIITSYQTAVAAATEPRRRVMYVLLKLSRLQVLILNTYDIHTISPNLVDGTGGTLVTVSGVGFPTGGTPKCKFGPNVGVGSGTMAWLLNETALVCKAPKVPNYDNCEDVSLEVSFGTTDRYSDNGVQVRHINLPIVFSVSPDRGSLVPSEPITLQGTGFINTTYVKCMVGGNVTRGTWLSSISMKCEQPTKDTPMKTTVEVTMDGQKFSQSGVAYYIIGKPVKMDYSIKDFSAQAGDYYTEYSTPRTSLRNITIRFYDSAGTFVGIRDEAIRGRNVTISLVSAPVAPRGPQYGRLLGTLDKEVSDGEVVFHDLHLILPGAGMYTMSVDFDNDPDSNSTVPSIGFQFRISARATRLAFVQPPTYFSTNKEKLTVQPILKFSDEAENVVSEGVQGVIAVSIFLNPSQSLPVVAKPDEACIWPGCKQYVAVVNGEEKNALPELEGNLIDDTEINAGVVIYKKLRIHKGLEGYNYTLRFSSKGIESADSQPIYIAECHPSSNAAIYKLVPDNGRLGSQLVTIKGWGFLAEEADYMLCKFGTDPPIKARFQDTCTMLCPLRAKVGPRNASLEIAYSADMVRRGIFTSLGVVYSYIDIVESLHAMIETNVYEYKSASLITIDPIVVTFRDSFGNWLRSWDTENRVVHLKSRLPILSSKLTIVAENAKVTFTGLQVKNPVESRYSLLFTTSSSDPIPTDADLATDPLYADKKDYKYLSTKTPTLPLSITRAPYDTPTITPTIIDPCHYPINCTLDTVCEAEPDGLSCTKNCNCPSEQACTIASQSINCVWKDGKCWRGIPCHAESYTCSFQDPIEITRVHRTVQTATPVVQPSNASVVICESLGSTQLIPGTSCLEVTSAAVVDPDECAGLAAQKDGTWYNHDGTTCFVYSGSCTQRSTVSGWIAGKVKSCLQTPTRLTVSASATATPSYKPLSATPTLTVSATPSLTRSLTLTPSISPTATVVERTDIPSGEEVWERPAEELLAPDECYPTATRSCPTMHTPKPSEFFVFRHSIVITIVEGTPHRMRFKIDGAIDPVTKLASDHYSLFTTSKRKLDIQPVIWISDVSNNVVNSFTVTPVIRATVLPYCRKSPMQTQDNFDGFSTTPGSPQGCLPGFEFTQSELDLGATTFSIYGPFCHGVQTAGITSAQWESQCTRLKGDNQPVLNGQATFTDLWFKGDPTVKYRIHFTVSDGSLPPLTSEPIRAVDCPCISAMCNIEPNWGFLSGGMTITIKGWDLQPRRQLKVAFGGQKLKAVYRDTCTATLTLPSFAAAKHEDVLGHTAHSLERSFHPQAVSTGSYGFQLIDESNVDFTSEPLPFQMKSPVPTRLGIASGCAETQSSCALINNTVLDDSVPCVVDLEDQSTIPKRCFKTDHTVNVGEVHVVLQDAAGGDLYEGKGFDTNHASDVEITITMLPPKTETREVHTVDGTLVQKQCDVIRGANCTAQTPLNGTVRAWTESGILRIQDFSMRYPLTGTYIMNFTTKAVNSAGVQIAWGALRLVIGVNVPHTYGFSTTPATVTDGKSPLVPAPTLEIRDVANNPLASGDIPIPISVKATLEPYELITLPGRPRRLVKDIPFDARWQSKVYPIKNSAGKIIPTGVPPGPDIQQPAMLLDNTPCSVPCLASEPSCNAGVAPCWLPLFSFEPADLGGVPLWSRLENARLNPNSPTSPPYHTGGSSQMNMHEAPLTSSAKVEFKGLLVSGVWHGVVYNLTYSIANSDYAKYLPAVSHTLTRTTCPTINGQTYFALNLSEWCLPCPTGASCDGTVFIKAKLGYWRASETDIQFYACKMDNCDRADRRLAGDQLCKEGTKGPTCAVCEKGWGRQGDTCTQCPPLGQSVVVVSLFVLGMLAVVFIMVKTNLGNGGKQKSRLSIIIKILMNYLQTATLMREFQTKVKDMVSNMLDVQEKASGPGTNFGGFSCATGWNQYSVFQMWMLCPLFIMVLPGFLVSLLYLRKKWRQKKGVEGLRTRRERRHSLGLDAVHEEQQIAQIYAMKTGKPIPKFEQGEEMKEVGASRSSASERAGGEDSDSSDSNDEEYVTSANLMLGKEVQEGWGQHPEAVEAEKIRRAKERAKLVDMEARAQELMAEERLAAKRALEHGTEAERKAVLDAVDAAHGKASEGTLAKYEAARSLLLDERPPEPRWEHHMSKKYNRRYWRNKDTGETTWHTPPEVVELAQWEKRQLEAIELIEEIKRQEQAAEDAPPRQGSIRRRVSAVLESAQDLLKLKGERRQSYQQLEQPQEPPSLERETSAGSVKEYTTFSEKDSRETQSTGTHEYGERKASTLRSELVLEMVEFEQELQPGDIVEVKTSDDAEWEEGVVVRMQNVNKPGEIEDGHLRAVVLVNGEERMYDYLRPPEGSVRTEEASEAHRKLCSLHAGYRIEAIDSVGAAKWRMEMTWVQRYKAAKAIEKRHQGEQKAAQQEINAMKTGLVSCEDYTEQEALMVAIEAKEKELQDRNLAFATKRLQHRHRWDRIARMINEGVRQRREERLHREQALERVRGKLTEARDMIRADQPVLHITKTEGECRHLSPNSPYVCQVQNVELVGTRILFYILAIGDLTHGPLFDPSNALVKVAGEKYAVNLVEHKGDDESDPQMVVDAKLTFALPEKHLLPNMKVTLILNKQWTTFSTSLEDEFGEGARPDEGIFKCTVCRMDIAVVACDYCGEEREPDVPWEKRTEPYFQPVGTRAALEERQRQLKDKAQTKRDKMRLSGELLCQVCHKVIHTEAEGTGPRYSHLTDRHSRDLPASIAGKRVLRKIVVPQEDPDYDVKTVAGAMRYQKERGQGVVEIYIVTVLVVIFLVYPRLMTEVATLMKCEEIEDLHESFLAADMEISCNTAKYRRWKLLAQLFFIMYGVGIPCAGGVLLYSYSGKDGRGLLKKSTNATLGFLYSGYRLNRYYWEMVIMFRKMLVVFILVFFEGDDKITAYRIMFGLWLMTGFLMLNIFARPFMYSRLWALENLALASVALSLNLSMLYADEYELHGAGEVVVTVCILLINLITMLTFLWVMVFDAGKEQILDVLDNDGDGDLTWDEVVHVARIKMYKTLSPVLAKMNIKMKDPAQAESDDDELAPSRAKTYEQSRRFAQLRKQREEDLARNRRELLGQGDSTWFGKKPQKLDRMTSLRLKKRRESLGVVVENQELEQRAHIDYLARAPSPRKSLKPPQPSHGFSDDMVLREASMSSSTASASSPKRAFSPRKGSPPK
eukprot:Sspe_Gene.7896::Locus_2681_Transcript_1_1_Confidence_1.000_Length_15939::g.7896::m.7896